MTALFAFAQRHAVRLHALNSAAQNTAFSDHGEFVLLWLHHAVRADENPALEIAIALSHAAGRPLLVYQGLAGHHRFNADRHHQFILQGARDLSAQLRALGINYVMHLPCDSQSASPLRQLMSRAAAVVCEDFPAPPFPRWSKALTRDLPIPAWAVDACSVLPMKTHARVFDRAFAFRDASRALWPEQIHQVWPAIHYQGGDVPAHAWADCGLQAVQWDCFDIDAALAGCAIDHTIAPIAHTLGGSVAGYARWNTFKTHGLPRYAALRNDAAQVQAVSRLSAYLHHGHISPFRIAREAEASGGAGAEKFLHELLVWRDLAHHWCFHQTTPERLACLPRWAQATLQSHSVCRLDAAAKAKAGLDEAALLQARSPDTLWNLAQLSLLRQGELHNNLRMTWGKSLALWAHSPKAALRQLVDFNHRFALDGNNPNSYGGLLWCLGLFDRPFSSQAKSALGEVRQRSTSVHANRLDTARYESFARPAQGSRLRIAIIGAGLAGLNCARALVDGGHTVQLFEKSRGVGGRLSTRHSDFASFDHGAQYFTARDPRFLRWVRIWREIGLIAPWRGALTAIDAHSLQRTLVAAQPRFVALPGMNALAKHLAETLRDQCELHLNTQIDALQSVGKGWRLRAAEAEYGEFDQVLIAVPAPQAAALLHALPNANALHALTQQANMLPCWASMLALSAPLAAVKFAGAFINSASTEHSVLRWIARDDSKPGRRLCAPVVETWVLHSTPEFALRHLEADSATIAALLSDAFARIVGEQPQIYQQTAHRWRYALGGLLEAGDAAVRERLSAAYLPQIGLGLAGDWLSGGRIEAAFLSGAALAGHVLRSAAAGSVAGL